MEAKTNEIAMPCAICGKDAGPDESLCRPCSDMLPKADTWGGEE
jgi:hypothetical protein